MLHSFPLGDHYPLSEALEKARTVHVRAEPSLRTVDPTFTSSLFQSLLNVLSEFEVERTAVVGAPEILPDIVGQAVAKTLLSSSYQAVARDTTYVAEHPDEADTRVVVRAVPAVSGHTWPVFAAEPVDYQVLLVTGTVADAHYDPLRRLRRRFRRPYAQVLGMVIARGDESVNLSPILDIWQRPLAAEIEMFATRGFWEPAEPTVEQKTRLVQSVLHLWSPEIPCHILESPQPAPLRSTSKVPVEWFDPYLDLPSPDREVIVSSPEEINATVQTGPIGMPVDFPLL